MKNININLNKGEKIALVGPNGSGKSTLIKVLLGLYETNEGEILIDGISLNDLDIKTIAQKYLYYFKTL